MPLYEDLHALLYMAIWPLMLDGRFIEASRGKNFSVLFNFKDWPPTVLLKVEDGKFFLETCESSKLASITVDARIEGYFEEAVKALDGIWATLKLLLFRKIKMHNKRVLLQLGHILLTKAIPHPGGELPR